MFKQKILNCEPIDLSRFVVDLRERHLEFWAPFSDGNPRERNSKLLTYHQWCALPTKRALVTQSPYSLPKYMFLDLPRDVIHSVARFRLCVHTLRRETTWGVTHTCDLCESEDNVQDERHVLFHCTHPLSLRRKYTCLFPLARSQDVFFCTRSTTNSIIFFTNSFFFNDQTSSHLLEWRPYPL